MPNCGCDIPTIRNREVSSAYNCTMLVRPVHISFMYIRTSNGPSTLPCGTFQDWCFENDNNNSVIRILGTYNIEHKNNYFKQNIST